MRRDLRLSVVERHPVKEENTFRNVQQQVFWPHKVDRTRAFCRGGMLLNTWARILSFFIGFSRKHVRVKVDQA